MIQYLLFTHEGKEYSLPFEIIHHPATQLILALFQIKDSELKEIVGETPLCFKKMGPSSRFTCNLVNSPSLLWEICNVLNELIFGLRNESISIDTKRGSIYGTLNGSEGRWTFTSETPLFFQHFKSTTILENSIYTETSTQLQQDIYSAIVGKVHAIVLKRLLQ